MKKFYHLSLALLFSISFTLLNSQTVVFEENFETQPFGVTASGSPAWTVNTNLSYNGNQSYYSYVGASDTSYLTTNSFSTLGNTFVLLEFAHICKINFFDGGLLQVSIDNGANWINLTTNEYLGTGQFSFTPNRFVAASYPLLWEATDATVTPNNSWWVKETFDISAIAGNQANVRIRFQLYDGLNPIGSGGNFGWVIDDIKVSTLQYLHDLSVDSILSPTGTFCYNGNEAVSIVIGNSGLDPIMGGFTASYTVDNGPAVTETVNSTIVPGDSIIYTFSTPLNFTLPGVDSTFILKTYVSASSDPYSQNDTLAREVTFLYVPPAPTAVNDTIPYGSPATLSVVSPHFISWYATSSPTDDNVLDTGLVFTTPPLYGNTVYYAEAKSGKGGFIITEICHFKTAAGQPVGGWPSYLVADDYIEITGPANADLEGYTLEMWSTSAQSFMIIFPQGTLLSPDGTCIIGLQGTGSNSPANFYYHYNAVSLGSATAQGFILKDPSGEIVDAAGYPGSSGYTFPSASGVDPASSSWLLPSASSTSGTRLIGPYTADATNWVVSSALNPQDPNTINPNVEPPVAGCVSSRTPVWAIVGNQPPVDAGVISIDAPITPTNLQSQSALVTIQNFGTDPLTSVTINWMNNGNIQTPHSWSGNLPTNQTAQVNIGTFTPVMGNNHLVAWTSNPNGVTDPMNLNDSASSVIIAFDPLCGTYTIGSSAANFSSFADAIFAMEDNGITCPVTFIVQPGTYNERIEMAAIPGASAANTIRFVGQPGAQISYAAMGTNDRATIQLAAAAHIRFDSLNIIAQGSTYGWGVYIGNNSENIEITNCNIETGNTSTGTFFSGIVVSGSPTGPTTASTNISNILIENNSISGGYYNITLVGGSSSPLLNARVINNSLLDSYYYGVYTNYADNVEIIGNEIDIRASATTSAYGIRIGYDNIGFDISKNKITNAGIYGIYVIGSNASSANKAMISNNAIGGGFKSTGTPRGIYLTSSSNIQVVYNSVLVDNGSGRALDITTTGTNIDVINNSFVFGGSGNGYASYIASVSSITQIDHNNYYVYGSSGGTSSNFVYYGSNISNLSTLQAVNNPPNNDQNSITGDPLYFSNSYLFPLSNLLYAVGTPISNVTDDINNDPRHSTNPSIGAFEYTPISKNLVLIDIVNPIGNNCYDGSEDVVIAIGNIGIDTAFGGFTASYRIDNGLPVTENVNDVVAPGDTVLYTFNTPINLSFSSTDTSFLLTAYVNHPSDPFPQNDTADKNINFLLIPSGPSVINDTILYGSTATLQAISPFSHNWYASASLLDDVVLDTGATFTTPVLYGNTAYYVAASSGTNISIEDSLETTFAGGTTTSNGGNMFDLVIHNPVNITGFSVSNSTNTISDVSVYYKVGSLQGSESTAGDWILVETVQGVALSSSGPSKFELTNPLNLPGGETYGIYIHALSGNFKYTSGGSLGDILASNVDMDILNGVTKGGLWGSTLSPRTWNGRVHYTPGSIGCESPRVEVWAIVGNQPPVDAGVVSIDAPVSPTNLQPQSALVTIQNFGTDPLTSVTINWMNNGNVQTPHSWSGNLPTNQTAQVNIGTFTPVMGNNHLVAWTSNPNGVTDPMNLNDSASSVIIAFDPLCGTYTIGSSAANFSSFADAIFAMEDNGITCPVTFIVQPGTYYERIEMAAIPGASAANTIRFVGQPGAQISYAATGTNDRSTIQLAAAAHIRFDSLSIIAQGSTYGWGVYIGSNSENIEITNCNIETGNTNTNTFFSGIVVSGSPTGPTTASTNISNILIENNSISGGYYNITLVGGSSSPLIDARVINNSLLDSYYYGVYTNYADGVEIIGNDIDIRATATTSSYGIRIGYDNIGFDISKNKITNAGIYGIYVIGSNASSANKALISNNAIGGGFKSTGTPRGIYLTSSSNIQVVYNSVLVDNGSGRALDITTTGTNIELLNNSFVFGGAGSGYASYIAAVSSITQIDHNNYYVYGSSGGTSSNFVYYGSNISNLSSLQAINNPPNNDQNSVSGDPIYYSNINLFPAGSILNNAGIPIAGITEDITGALRSTTTPDIGAYEYTPANIDAAATAILNISPFENGGSTIAPTIIITNWGMQTLTSIPIKYTINGGAPVTQIWSGSLAPYMTDTVTFTTSFTVPNGNFTFCAYTDVTGDGNQNNDTTCVSAFGIPLVNLPFTDDFEGQINYFYTMGVSNEWEKGTPSANVINSAHSPSNVWTTNLTGNYSANSNYNLMSPRFNFSNTNNVLLSFWYWIDSEINIDGGRIQYTTNNGINWVTLGSVGDPLATNWYNSSNINGAPAFSGHSAGWVNATYNLSQFDNYPTPVQFRFNFFANPSVQYNGWAIDNFELLRDAIPHDAGVIAINSPGNQSIIGTTEIIEVSIKNFGTDTLFTIPVRFRVNQGVPVQETWTGVLLPDSVVSYTFSNTATETTSYNLCAFTRVINDTYLFNDTTCKYINIIPAQYDAAITQIITPQNQTVIGQAVSVSVMIKNAGTEPLTSFDVAYDINAGAKTIETWTGNLAPNDSTTYNFSSPYISPHGNYILCVESQLSSDQNLTNDRICKSITAVTSIDDDKNKLQFSLEQNIPNPSEKQTAINYFIPHNGTIVFNIVNSLGQIVYEEFGQKYSGKHQINLNVENMPKGLYHYSLEYEGQRIVRRMVIN